jgi:hypothetical protein
MTKSHGVENFYTIWTYSTSGAQGQKIKPMTIVQEPYAGIPWCMDTSDRILEYLWLSE